MTLPQRFGMNPPTIIADGESTFSILDPAPGGSGWGAKSESELNVLRRGGGDGVEAALRV